MYDNINNEQVKCFGVPCLYGSDGVSLMGGQLRCFKNGKKVPYKTLYYEILNVSKLLYLFFLIQNYQKLQ